MSDRIIIIHDGAMDELMAVALVGSMPGKTIEYIGVINGDCIAYTTVQLTSKVMQLCGFDLQNIYLSDARAVNPFPLVVSQRLLKRKHLAPRQPVPVQSSIFIAKNQRRSGDLHE